MTNREGTKQNILAHEVIARDFRQYWPVKFNLLVTAILCWVGGSRSDHNSLKLFNMCLGLKIDTSSSCSRNEKKWKKGVVIKKQTR